MEQLIEKGNVIIVMGVSGSGKTTVGKLLAERLGLPFHDADEFHSAENIEKMDQGTPLTDEDRQPWLAALSVSVADWEANGGAVLACSALKESYRQTLQRLAQCPVQWVFLDGSEELIRERVRHRTGHYMHEDLLDSQFATLEKPSYGIHLSVANKAEDLVDQAVQQLQAEK